MTEIVIAHKILDRDQLSNSRKCRDGPHMAAGNNRGEFEPGIEQITDHEETFCFSANSFRENPVEQGNEPDFPGAVLRAGTKPEMHVANKIISQKKRLK